MRILSIRELDEAAVRELGLDSDALDLTSPEALAAYLRYTASFLAPCPPNKLVQTTLRSLRGIREREDGLQEEVVDALDAIVAHGDLIEQQTVSADDASQGTLLYLAPPAFVRRSSGIFLLLGVAPEGTHPIPVDTELRIDHVKHVRRLTGSDGRGPLIDQDHLANRLTDSGLIELKADYWMRAPQAQEAKQLLAKLDAALDSAEPSPEVPGLSIIKPKRSVRYYRGRWGSPSSESGRFVGRRQRAYGADIWCYIELQDGNPRRLVDLPIEPAKWRGCDEAWHLQAAIDATLGYPQLFRVRQGTNTMTAIDLFSPIPSWAQRRWDAVGEPTLPSGCLLTYLFDSREIDEELRFAQDRLWLSKTTG